MRKLKLFVATVALMSGGVTTAVAQVTPENDGVYYLYNQESGLFLTRGESWGTQAVAKPVGLPWKVSVADDKYTLRMYDITVAGSNSGFGSNCYSDNGSPLQFTPSGSATDGFTLQDGSNYITCPATAGPVSLSTTSSAWQFLTQAQYNAVLAAKMASQEAAVASAAGIEISSGSTLNDIVTDADNWAAAATVNDGVPTQATWTATKNSNRGGNNNWDASYGSEMYQCGDAHYTRTITGLKQGIYKVSIRGMKRMGNNETCMKMGDAGFPVSDAYLTANGNVIRIKAWYEDKASANNPNSTGDFVNIVNGGGYTSEGFVYVGEDGKLVMDASSEAFWGGSWFLFNGISYTYYSNTVSDEDATEILSQATTLESQNMEATVKEALTSAKSTFNNYSTIANYNALSTAITNANSSVAAYASAKAYFDEAETILANTNVYTAEAYATYYTEPKAKYDEGTLTTAEANALTKTSAGWHSANTIDDILLSSWTIGGKQCANYDKSLYINTWSVEGNNDGSEFLTPFFEYWIEDAKSLGANTLVATVSGLTANETYSFTIRARVRQTDNATKIANGITMKVGDGEAVDISSGAQFGTGQFYIGNFSAVGKTDSEGKLTCTITVAENSNISWLSFYNCKYTEGEDLSAYIADYEFALKTAKENSANAAYAAVTGKEKAELASAIETYASVDNDDKDALIAAKEALETASNAFVSAVSAYTSFAELNPTVAETLDVTLPTIDGTTTAADLNVEGIIVSEYTAAKEYTQDCTNMLGAWENAPGTNKGESWNGTGDDTYYDLYNSADRAMSQTVTLPAGDYALIAKGRASVNGLLTLTVGDETVTFAHKSSAGRGIATDGTATFADDATYANTAGRGWEYRVMTFTSTGEPITLTFNWKTASYNWCGLDDIELRGNLDATMSYDELETAVNNVTIPTLGFEEGEYAPYTNAANFASIKAAKDMLANKNATSQEDIDALKDAITGMPWTANADEVNAIAYGDFAEYETVDGKDYPYGWNLYNTGNNSRIMGGSEGTNNTGLSAASTGKALLLKFNATYGESEGYTMPLKAGKIYKISFKYGGWNNTPNTIVSLTDPSNNAITLAPNFKPATNDAHNDASHWYNYTGYFVSTTEGDYKLNLNKVESGQQQIIIADIDLRTASEIEFADADVPTYAPGTYPSVKISREFSADKWATAVYPFAVSATNVAVLKSFDTESGKLAFETASASTANVPFLLKNSGAITLSDVEVVAAAATDATAGDATLKGVYTTTEVDNTANNYVLKDNKVFKIGANAATVNPYRAYIQLAETAGEARELTITVDGEATAIEGITAEKTMNGEIYNLNGQRVKTAKKGIYVVNGKAVIVK